MKKARIIVADMQNLKLNPEKILPLIAPRYVEKYKQFKIQKEAEQELVTGYMLKEYLGVISDEQLKINKQGKPYLAEGKPYFNVSHSGTCVVLAIADCEIGVDVEGVRKYHPSTAKRVFSEEQLQALLELEGDAQNKAFSKMWTECEAVLKLQGTGFTIDWKQIRECKKGCIVESMCVNDYYISCATREAITVQLEKNKMDSKRIQNGLELGK